VVYFYPKADSPGCTEQACAFRDAIKKIESRNGKLVGISADSQDSQKKFHDKHNLTFDLLADSDSKVISQYGVKVPLIGVARRTTFIVDPELKIRSIARDVDPAFDADWTAETLDELQSDTSKPSSAPAKTVTPSSGKPTKQSSGKAK
ncbi:MAG: peroxiredoxin, partial [Proteobacteria bacterium]|nr:peroxiredoxin [Pseudomonadota bacterium]